MSFVLPSSQRIRQSKVFVQALSHKGLTNKWFTIHVIDSEYELARLGMIVSKRTIPKSVCRNYTKRLIRELFRLNSSKLPAFDFIVRIRRNMTRDSAVEAKEALLQLLLGTQK